MMGRTDIEGAVVVVTGASSGIGRAAALEFARRGAHVVATARRGEALETLRRECEAMGPQALAVPADVTDAEAVENVARTAVARFGRLDVWVNNAAVTVFGKFHETPPKSWRRVIETNLFGYVNGARAALRHFRATGRGILINNASMLGKAGAPYLSAYTASKFAVVGLGESLRQELILDGLAGIHVSTILPASIDTPLFQHAGNYAGRAAKPIHPIYDAGAVAEAIVRCAERPRREAFVGSAGTMLTATRRLSPRLYEQMYARQVHVDHFQDVPAPPGDGNLFEPVAHGAEVSGGWQTGVDRAATSRKPLALGAAGALALGLLLRNRASTNGSRRG